jgi:hypothetical protein
VGLSGSEPGINYQLQFNGSDTGGTYQGNGNPIDFGYQYNAGTYTVVASNATIICTQNMNGTAVVVQNPLPDQNVTYNGNNNICPSSTLLLSTSTGTGYTYQWRRDGNDIQVQPTQHMRRARVVTIVYLSKQAKVAMAIHSRRFI